MNYLGGRRPQDRTMLTPQLERVDLDADLEQQQHHADIREELKLVVVRDVAGGEGRDDKTDGQIPEHRRQPKPASSRTSPISSTAGALSSGAGAPISTRQMMKAADGTTKRTDGQAVGAWLSECLAMSRYGPKCLAVARRRSLGRQRFDR